MIRLRHNLHRNNYLDRITSALRNLDRKIVDNTWKLNEVYLPYFKGLAERIQNICSPYDIRTILTNGLTLRRYLFRVKPPKNFVHLILQDGFFFSRNVFAIIIIIIIIIIISTFEFFHISVSWWFFTGVSVTASLLKFPGLVSGFWLFLAMLPFG